MRERKEKRNQTAVARGLLSPKTQTPIFPQQPLRMRLQRLRSAQYRCPHRALATAHVTAAAAALSVEPHHLSIPRSPAQPPITHHPLHPVRSTPRWSIRGAEVPRQPLNFRSHPIRQSSIASASTDRTHLPLHPARSTPCWMAARDPFRWCLSRALQVIGGCCPR